MSFAWSVLKFERRIKKILAVSSMIWSNRISQYPKLEHPVVLCQPLERGRLRDHAQLHTPEEGQAHRL